MKKQIFLDRLHVFFRWKPALLMNAAFSFLGCIFYLGIFPVSDEGLAIIIGNLLFMNMGVAFLQMFHENYFKNGLIASIKEGPALLLVMVFILGGMRIVAVFTGKHDDKFYFEVVNAYYVLVWTVLALGYFKWSERTVRPSNSLKE